MNGGPVGRGLGARLGLLLVCYYAVYLACSLLLELSDAPALAAWLRGWFGAGHGRCV